MVDSNCKGASVPDYNKSEGAKLGSFVINQRSGASKCRKTRNTTSHFDSQPLVNLVNYQSKFREEEEEEEASLPLLPFPPSFRTKNFIAFLSPSIPPPPSLPPEKRSQFLHPNYPLKIISSQSATTHSPFRASPSRPPD